MKYTFFPESVFDASDLTDPKSKEPISFFLIKKAPRVEAEGKFGLKEKQKKLERQAKTEFKHHQDYYEAKKMKEKEARTALSLLADLGHARAQYDFALMARDGLGGPRDLDAAKRFAKKAAKQGLPEIEFPDPSALPTPNLVAGEGTQTKTGAIYRRVQNHPKLGAAWIDPRGLTWSDHYMRDANGNILQLTWERAKEHCYALNGDPASIAEVKQRYQAREDQLKAMRAQFQNAPLGAEDTRLYGELIRRSQEFGVIAGCYLPSREELANHGVDLGYARANSRFSREVFTEYDNQAIWSGSAHPTGERGAFVFSGGGGFVGDGSQSNAKAFRCACSP